MHKHLLERVPEKVRKIIGGKSPICLLSGKDVFTGLKDEKLIVMGCNPRIKHAIPGIMKAAEELDAVVAFELTKTEGGLDGGYTGQTPDIFCATIFEYAHQYNFTKPFVIHGDHITIRNREPEEFSAAASLAQAQIEAGFTSFAFDASFNPLPQNIDIVVRLAKQVAEHAYGLELELGEAQQEGEVPPLTTVEETEAFLYGVEKHGVSPQLLAINNGSKRGNYLEGEVVRIDLARTLQVYKAAVAHGLSGLVQHGITGTPLHLVGKLAGYGIRKGNIGTLWQNVAHAGLPLELMDAMRRWARENNRDIKYATRVFKDEIDNIPEYNARQIHDMAYREAREFLTAFYAKGSATKLANALSHH
ncbi:MAG TPA: class II fructose-bisphosphate aldolase [Geobacteraceae bacterium]|jgi:fructose-bisphosphate aldolase class II|nr:class II fructose-bisphosphate aldolase [Geobacteraceae bacterium]